MVCIGGHVVAPDSIPFHLSVSVCMCVYMFCVCFYLWVSVNVFKHLF